MLQEHHAIKVECDDLEWLYVLMHGATDSQVGIEHSRQLYNQLKEADKHVLFYEIEGVDHGGPVFWTKEILDIMDSFIQ